MQVLSVRILIWNYLSGVPKLKRSELETACEDFSNVIGSSSIGTLYKGTLSSGVEIAVAIVPPTTAKDWSENLEMQFLKKVLGKNRFCNITLFHLFHSLIIFSVCFRSTHCQNSTTRTLSTSLGIVRKMNLSLE